jgi:hypothetical protein
MGPILAKWLHVSKAGADRKVIDRALVENVARAVIAHLFHRTNDPDVVYMRAVMLQEHLCSDRSRAARERIQKRVKRARTSVLEGLENARSALLNITAPTNVSGNNKNGGK